MFSRPDPRTSEDLLDSFRSIISSQQRGWQLTATSTVLVLSEVVYGASLAWKGLSGFEARFQGASPWALDERSPRDHTHILSDILSELTRPELLRTGECSTYKAMQH